MKNVELRKGDGFQLLVEPEDPVDSAILAAMSEAAAHSGAAIEFFYKDGVAVVSVKVRSGLG